jgi:hypothetical protein
MNALMTVAALLLLVTYSAYRSGCSRNAAGIERAQLKWLAYAGMFAVIGNILGGIPYWLWPDDPLTQELSIVATDITIVGIVVATGIAILRYRLWDIDILINRTLVYFSLTALVVGIYVVIVGSLGTLFQTGGSLPVSLLATGIVAMSFQPLRERLQLGESRVAWGAGRTFAVLGRLAERLEVVIASQFVLPTGDCRRSPAAVCRHRAEAG